MTGKTNKTPPPKTGREVSDATTPAWSSPSVLVEDRTAAGPRCVCLNSVTWVVWKDFYSSEIYYAYGSGDSWSQPVSLGVRTVSAPAITVHNNQIYIAWRNYNDNFIFWSAYDGDGWSIPAQVPGARTFENPAICSYDGKLYLSCNAGQYAGQTAALIFMWFDGENWSDAMPAGLSVYSGPAMAVYNQALYIAVCPERGQPVVLCLIQADLVVARLSLGATVTDSGPALASDGDRLWLMWKGVNVPSLLSMPWGPGMSIGEIEQVNGAKTIFSPGLCGDFSGLRAIWKDYGTDELRTSTLLNGDASICKVSGKAIPYTYVTVSLAKGEMSQSYAPVIADGAGYWSTSFFANQSDGDVIEATASYEEGGPQSDAFVKVIGEPQYGVVSVSFVTPTYVCGKAPEPGQIIKGWRSSDGLLIVDYPVPPASNDSDGMHFRAPYIYPEALSEGDVLNLVSQFPDDGTMTPITSKPEGYLSS